MSTYESYQPHYVGREKYDPRIRNTKTGEILVFSMMCTDTASNAWSIAGTLAKMINEVEFYIRSSVKWRFISIALLIYSIATTIALTH